MRLHPIPNWPFYYITKAGKVYSDHPRANTTKKSKLHRLAQWTAGRHNYPSVTMCRNGEQFNECVHRLMLQTFVGPAPKGMQCLHRDGNPANVKLSNLHWGNRSENQMDRLRHGTDNRGERHGMHKLNRQQVLRIKSMLRKGKYHKHIAVLFDVHKSTISKIALGESWGWLKH